MEYVNLGKTGLKVSRICLGCMTYGAPATGELKGGRHAWAWGSPGADRAGLDAWKTGHDITDRWRYQVAPP
jgi:aryl-alcohol dehydrogenase-like predicted oxidoreductase